MKEHSALLVALCGVPLAAHLSKAVARQEFRVLVWHNTIPQEVYREFEALHGNSLRVVEECVDSNESLRSKLYTGIAAYSFAMPSFYILDSLREMGLIRPLGDDLQALATQAADPRLGDRWDWGVPLYWGLTGFAIASRGPKFQSYREFFDPEFLRSYGRKSTLMDAPREVIGAALKSRGHSVNSVNEADLAEAFQILARAKSELRGFDSVTSKSSLGLGDHWIAQAWNGDTARLGRSRRESGAAQGVEFIVPEEGGLLWADLGAIPSSTPDLALSRKFVEYLLRPAVNARVAARSGNAASVPEARAYTPADLLADPAVYISSAQVAAGEWIQDIGAHIEKYERVWLALKSL